MRHAINRRITYMPKLTPTLCYSAVIRGVTIAPLASNLKTPILVATTTTRHHRKTYIQTQTNVIKINVAALVCALWNAGESALRLSSAVDSFDDLNPGHPHGSRLHWTRSISSKNYGRASTQQSRRCASVVRNAG